MSDVTDAGGMPLAITEEALAMARAYLRLEGPAQDGLIGFLLGAVRLALAAVIEPALAKAVQTGQTDLPLPLRVAELVLLGQLFWSRGGEPGQKPDASKIDLKPVSALIAPYQPAKL